MKIQLSDLKTVYNDKFNISDLLLIYHNVIAQNYGKKLEYLEEEEIEYTSNIVREFLFNTYNLGPTYFFF